MKKYDDPLHPASIRSAAASRRNYRRWGVATWDQFRRTGAAINAPITLLRVAEEAHDDAFAAGVKYALKAMGER